MNFRQGRGNIPGKMLRVVVSSATDLPNVESFGKSDPYCLIIFQGRSRTLLAKGEVYYEHSRLAGRCLVLSHGLWSSFSAHVFFYIFALIQE